MKLIVLATLLTILAGCGDHDHHGAPPSPAPTKPAENPVQHEMRLLTRALETTVRSIGQGDVRAVEHELHQVHAAKEATEAAIREGRYRLPRNPEGLEQFRALDEAFHHDLERLVEASRHNDVGATAVALGGVVQRCQGCHTAYRP